MQSEIGKCIRIIPYNINLYEKLFLRMLLDRTIEVAIFIEILVHYGVFNLHLNSKRGTTSGTDIHDYLAKYSMTHITDKINFENLRCLGTNK